MPSRPTWCRAARWSGDRAHLDAVLKEQELGPAGTSSPPPSPNWASCWAQRAGDREREPLRPQPQPIHQGGAQHRLQHQAGACADQAHRHTSLDFSATVQVVDLSTGRVFGAQRLEDGPSLSNSSYEGVPAYPRDAEVRRLAFETAKVKVLRCSWPGAKVRKLTFFDDETFGMAKAHERLKARDLRGAMDLARRLEQSKRDKGQKPSTTPAPVQRRHHPLHPRPLRGGPAPLCAPPWTCKPDASIFQTACGNARRPSPSRKPPPRRKPQRTRDPGPSQSRRPPLEPRPPHQAQPRRAPAEAPRALQKGLLDKKDYDAKKAEILKDL